VSNFPAEDLNEKYDPMSRDELIARCERLERERSEWASVAATRNLNNALLAEERDRMRNALLDARSWILDKCHDVDMAPAIEGIERALGCYRTSGATVTRG
jgi:hypothetical protein